MSAVLGILYFLYFAAAGVFVTFWPYRLQALGMSEGDVGVIFGVRTAIGIVSQLALAAFVSRISKPWGLIIGLFLWTLLTSLGMPFALEGLVLAGLMWLQIPSTSATVPVLDTSTIAHVGARRYGRLRLWGSLGYGVVVAIFGLVVDGLDYDLASQWAMWIYAGLGGAALAVALFLPRTAVTFDLEAPTLKQLSADRGLWLLFLVSGLHWSTVMIFNIYFPLYTKALGFGTGVPGIAILVAVMSEFVAFLGITWLLGRATPSRWMVLVLGAGVVRWGVTAFSADPIVLIAAQAIHFLSFGVWLAVNIELLGRFAPEKSRGSLQALFFAVVFGGGGVVGSVGGGYLTELGGGELAFTVAGGLEALALVLWLLISRRGAFQPAP